MGSIRNPKQYCFAIIAAMGSIQNPKQYCFAVSSITTHKVLTSWMHEASHWKCQCRILTARTSGHGKKMCRTWSQLAGNMPGHLALIRGNESHIGDYNLIFFVLFFVVWIVVTVSVTRQSQINTSKCHLCIHMVGKITNSSFSWWWIWWIRWIKHWRARLVRLVRIQSPNVSLPGGASAARTRRLFRAPFLAYPIHHHVAWWRYTGGEIFHGNICNKLL